MLIRPHHRSILLCAAAALVLAAAGAKAAPPRGPAANTAPAIVRVAADDAVATAIAAYVTEGRDRVESFFGRSFPKPYTVEILGDRAAFNAYFKSRWNLPETQPWMVASGVADRLAILSPRVWKTEAQEHDPDDRAHVRDIVAHELVHVFHGQANPRPDFDGMDDLGWFIEGLAVFVSGQLERSHRGMAAEAVKAGKAPATLADAWSGRYRYGVAGSMASFVDRRYGRQVLSKMLEVVSNDEALALMKTTESDFLAAWKASLTATP